MLLRPQNITLRHQDAKIIEKCVFLFRNNKHCIFGIKYRPLRKQNEKMIEKWKFYIFGIIK